MKIRFASVVYLELLLRVQSSLVYQYTPKAETSEGESPNSSKQLLVVV